jgi:hypothetical protein
MARQKNIIQFTESLGAVSAATSSEVLDIKGGQVLSCQAVNDVATAKTFDSGGAEVDTATFPDKATIGAGDYIVINDTAGLSWAIAADKDGDDPEPTGAIWTAIPAARKAQVDLTAATTDAEVAAAFEVAFNALTDVPFTAADSTADVAFTQDLYGVVAAPSVHNADDSGAGTITVVVTDAGVASEVDVDASTMTIPGHDFTTGLEVALTDTGTSPAPLTTTDYYVIVVDANTIQLAETEEDALDGTFIELEDQGSDENVTTLTPAAISGASIKLQKTNDPETAAGRASNWVDEGSATNITADSSVFMEKVDPAGAWYRATIAISAGSFTCDLHWVVKGIDG